LVYRVRPMNNIALIYKFVSQVFPLVKQDLCHWRKLAENSVSTSLAEQAVASIDSKSFHCLGGSIYALYPGVSSSNVVEFIVAYQTISDYLDNLVDSLQVHDEQAFAQLHLAMTEALNPEVPTSDYYLYYPYKNDGGYLQTLVETCRARVAGLPSYQLVKLDMLWLARLYSQLQTYKHLDSNIREAKLRAWLEPYSEEYTQVFTWELAAATGSTLGIFCLYAAASTDLSAQAARQIREAYFPWICGLHILLDYFIDLEEDLSTDQFNFVAFYASTAEKSERLQLFVQKSLALAATLPYPNFHKAVVQGLLAMYLSDSKASFPDMLPTSKKLLAYGGKGVELLHWICAKLRERKII
jgi:tetraprenyl-beta-curcumene synthase